MGFSHIPLPSLPDLQRWGARERGLRTGKKPRALAGPFLLATARYTQAPNPADATLLRLRTVQLLFLPSDRRGSPNQTPKNQKVEDLSRGCHGASTMLMCQRGRCAVLSVVGLSWTTISIFAFHLVFNSLLWPRLLTGPNFFVAGARLLSGRRSGPGKPTHVLEHYAVVMPPQF